MPQLFGGSYFQLYIYRETKLVQRASKHMQKTAQRFLDEQAFLSSSFFLLEDDVIEYERRAARNHFTNSDVAVSHSRDLETISKEESYSRKEEDVVVLDTVIETQQILQQMVSRRCCRICCYRYYA